MNSPNKEGTQYYVDSAAICGHFQQLFLQRIGFTYVAEEDWLPPDDGDFIAKWVYSCESN